MLPRREMSFFIASVGEELKESLVDGGFFASMRSSLTRCDEVGIPLNLSLLGSAAIRSPQKEIHHPMPNLLLWNSPPRSVRSIDPLL